MHSQPNRDPATPHPPDRSSQAPDVPVWAADGLLFHSLGHFLRRKFGGAVRKVSVDVALGCPNRDGTVSSAGCIFCDPTAFSPSRRGPSGTITEQIDEGVRRIRTRFSVEKFIAYFQPETNTYAPVDRLREMFEEAIGHPRVVALAVGTRPDCVADEALDLLAQLAQRTDVTLELGIQTFDDDALRWMNRGHDAATSLDAVARARSSGLSVGAHLILGLPDETRDMVKETARTINRLGIESVKLHNLYAVRGTKLAELVESGEVELPDRPEYIERVVRFLEELDPACVIDRLSGEAPPHFVVAPKWCLSKANLRQAIEARLRERGSRQGSRFRP